jgi:hypothetical protein
MVFISNEESGKPPLVLNITLYSVLNGLYTDKPFPDSIDDEWRLYYEIKPIPFEKSLYESKLKQYNSWFTKCHSKGGRIFNSRLKQQLSI